MGDRRGLGVVGRSEGPSLDSGVGRIRFSRDRWVNQGESPGLVPASSKAWPPGHLAYHCHHYPVDPSKPLEPRLLPSTCCLTKDFYTTKPAMMCLMGERKARVFVAQGCHKGVCVRQWPAISSLCVRLSTRDQICGIRCHFPYTPCMPYILLTLTPPSQPPLAVSRQSELAVARRQ